MKRGLLLALMLGCASGSRPPEPERWRELRTAHFVLRTDLAAEDARRVAVDLEEVRGALLAAGWHASNMPDAPVHVVVLADDRELQEYAIKGIEGFVASDAFGDPIMVVSGSQNPDEQRFLKHELAHVITNQFLVRNPRWVAEGVACYLGTLRLDRKRGTVIIGTNAADRVLYLRQYPVRSFWPVLNAGDDFQGMSVEDGWAFETASWALVHWLVDERPKAFDDLLARLARG